jgi:hypothetical protein
MRYKREGDCGCGFVNGAGVKSDDILAVMDMGPREGIVILQEKIKEIFKLGITHLFTLSPTPS